MSKDTETCFIFGCSPFINEIKEYIPIIQERYTTIGLNAFPKFYPDVDYWFFIDDNNIRDNVKGNYTGQHLFFHSSLISEFKCYGEENWKYTTFDLTHRMTMFDDKKFYMKRNGCTTLFPALTYAKLLGLDSVVLVGVDLTVEWGHFYDDHIQKAKRGKIENMRDALYEFKDYLRIIKINEDSDLDLEYMDIKDFCKQVEE